jgi:hypothetical protein
VDTKNNVFMFPLVKKFADNLPPNASDDDKKKYAKHITQHYMSELIKKFGQHGIVLDDTFIKDITLASDFVYSAVLRAEGITFPLQSYVDEFLKDNTPAPTAA